MQPITFCSPSKNVSVLQLIYSALVQYISYSLYSCQVLAYRIAPIIENLKHQESAQPVLDPGKFITVKSNIKAAEGLPGIDATTLHLLFRGMHREDWGSQVPRQQLHQHRREGWLLSIVSHTVSRRVLSVLQTCYPTSTVRGEESDRSSNIPCTTLCSENASRRASFSFSIRHAALDTTTRE